jgi:signal transduction histidine kinase
MLLLIFLLIYTFGAVAFSALFVLSMRQCAKRHWREPADRANAAILFVSALWFVVNLTITFREMYQTPDVIWHWYASMMGVACVFPPLMALVFYHEEKAFLPATRFWSAAIGVITAAAIVQGGFSIAFAAGWFDTRPLEMMRAFSVALFVLFGATVTFALVVRQKSRREVKSTRERQHHRWTFVLLTLTVGLFLLIILSIYWEFPFGKFIGLASRALPLGFISVGTYFKSRFEFFDAFVKQGFYFLLALVLLTAFFAVIPALMENVELGWAQPWVYAVFMLPIVLVVPWLNRLIGAWLDRAWLGRRFTTVEAVKHFLGRLKGATSVEDLVDRAETSLETIVQAPTRILLGEHAAPVPFEVELTTEIPSQGIPEGHIVMGKRQSDEPFFSQDITLVASLSDVLYSLLATLRLQARKQEQEKREQELILNASRSELKALRAQINPHFLFNALNAIAGLIHRDPERAEETVESLAEVFRYTLRRSESEWVLLKDELEFIEAYLEIERARFGDRLSVSLKIEENTRDCRIPAMLIQTIVENAIKHGVASVRGPGIVTVKTGRSDNRLQIEVWDNGPGFDLDSLPGPGEARVGGYGLRNVRQRLEGYFGEGARLTVARSREGQTCVTLAMPLFSVQERLI